MTPRAEKSHLKRGLPSQGDGVQESSKKPRRSQRLQSQTTPLSNDAHLPSPLTHNESTATEDIKDAPTTPLEDLGPESHHQVSITSPSLALSSPPGDTQAFSQFVYPPQDLTHEVEDEEAEGVWGYLVPLDDRFGDTLVLKKRSACPLPSAANKLVKRTPNSKKDSELEHQEEAYEKSKTEGTPAGGYIVGRHPECDRIIDFPSISNRHCIFFPEKSHGKVVVVLEDLSTNGTFINDATVGRNKRRQLKDADEVSFVGQARCSFRQPKHRHTSAFRQQYTLLQQLGKGHFATVHLCAEKASGLRYAVKIFNKRSGVDDRSKTEGLQQEIAVLMSVSHPNMLCLKDTFDEDDGVYLVLELAPEGELFNLIITKSKLTEKETRRIFVQLFQGIKYLHERNIVHRDIKPENILLVDKDLNVKVADFGLAKIIGEESFTTTLCGTPSYVAPEILESSDHRKYTRAVDVWSLGVVLYICLCGFPPFSDELYNAQHPYNLSQQIKMGRFDYPSPYWDPVGDPALDLIDHMLTVDVDERYTIDDCLRHPWITEQFVGLNDSTDGLTGAMGQLDFSRRKVERERTLLSSINDVRLAEVIDLRPNKDRLKIYDKNPDKEVRNGVAVKDKADKADKADKEETPAARRDVNEFMQIGGKGDESLFGNDAGSVYVPDKAVRAEE
ncbi:MAG: hypothetical protein M1833_003283 [Piccolia ochrophora]|nr:MAG: hypothetical protein M1833_003283 [Piccolia ochrophora]